MFKFLLIISAIVIFVVHLSSTANTNCIVVPNICPNENITFWLYKRKTPLHGVKTNDIDAVDDCFYNTKLDLDNPWLIRDLMPDDSKLIKILIHGFTKNKDDAFNQGIRQAFLKLDNIPYLISVDWSPITAKGCRAESSQNVRVVGNCTAQLIDTLVNLVGIQIKKIHVIGFSLGAQATAFIQKNMQSGTLHRISGLDPTLPLFETDDTDKRLDASDGHFVDVYHTAAGTRGQIKPCGHLDVYFNGGRQQPGCAEEDQNKDDPMGCSHKRSPKYYAESINTTSAFYGVHCTSKEKENILHANCHNSSIRLGYFVPYGTRGVFKVKTNSSPPFAIQIDE